MKKHTLSIFLPVLLPFIVSAQQQEAEAGRVTPKEFTIPPSPVFDLMGVTPSQINRTADIKDFKVDWSFKSWRLNPNLAIQSQPFWEMLYNRKNLEKYQQASGFMRRLASLDLSIGSVQNEDNDRRIGYAAKFNLIKSRDPLLEKDLYAGISAKYETEKAELEKQLADAKIALDTAASVMLRPQLREALKALEEQYLTINSRRSEEINQIARVFVQENWNASSLDIAVGRIYTYKTDSAGSLKSLRLNRNTAYGGWMNGSLGIGKRILLTGLFRTTWYEEELNFLVQNKTTFEEQQLSAVADNTLFTMGFNFRYGGPLYTFFVEMLYERKGIKTAGEALAEVFNPENDFQVVSSSVKWDVVHPNTLSFGGDWRISRSVMLNYGMRCIFDKNWKFHTFTPVATIACMMR